MNVLVVGDVMLDVYVHGVTERLSPEAPVAVLLEGTQEAQPGGAAAAAIALRTLGAEVVCLGAVGDDEDSKLLALLLEAEGIQAALPKAADRPTTRKTRYVSRGQQMLRVDREVCARLPRRAEQALMAELRTAAKSADGVLVSDYGKGVVQPHVARACVEAARNRAVPCVVDPYAGGDELRYRGASLICPNRAEAKALARLTGPFDPALAASTLCTRLALDACLVTLDRDGMVLWERGADAALTLPARTREVFDVTGAGDVVAAGVTYGLATGMDIEDAARLANRLAGVAVTKAGAQPVSLGEGEES